MPLGTIILHSPETDIKSLELRKKWNEYASVMKRIQNNFHREKYKK